MKIVSVTILGMLLLLVSSFSLDVRDDLTWLNGNWAGQGYQPNLTSTWTITLDCNAKKKRFRIAYPSLNCEGFWKIESTEINRVVFKEKIAKGGDRCIPEGTVIVTKVNEKHITYSYFLEIEGELVLSSFSTLTKKT